MQELDSVISAAEEMEAKLNLAAKQDQPSLAAIAAPVMLCWRTETSMFF